jgi:hypothetical protein
MRFGGSYMFNVNQLGATGSIDPKYPPTGPMFWITLSFKEHWPIFVGIIVFCFIAGCIVGLLRELNKRGS